MPSLLIRQCPTDGHVLHVSIRLDCVDSHVLHVSTWLDHCAGSHVLHVSARLDTACSQVFHVMYMATLNPARNHVVC